MISSTDLVNYSQLNIMNFQPDNRKSDETGVTFADLLNSEIKDTTKEVKETQKKPEEIKAEKTSEQDDLQELENIEIELDINIEEKSILNQNILVKNNPDNKNTDKKDNQYKNALLNLNAVMKNNIAEPNKKNTALNLLSENTSQKIKVSVKSLDLRAKTKTVSVLKDFKAGKITKQTAQIKLADIVAGSEIGKKIQADKVKTGKNVKIQASILDNKQVKKTSIPEKRISGEDLALLNKTSQISETKQAKTQNTKDTEVNRKDERKTKVKTAKTDNAENVSNQNVNGDKALHQFETALDLKIDNANINKNSKSDIKAVLSDNKQTIFNNLAENTKFIQTHNMTKFSMVMRPENVGRMDFQLSVKDGKIGGKIILQTQEAADFFKANIEEITAVFRKANVELSSLDVAVAGQGFGGSSDQYAQNSKGEGFSNEMLDTMKVNSHYSHRALSAFESNATVASGSYGNSKINLLI